MKSNDPSINRIYRFSDIYFTRISYHVKPKLNAVVYEIRTIDRSILVEESKSLDPGVSGESLVLEFTVRVCHDSVRERRGLQGPPSLSERVERVVLVTDPGSVPQ